MSRKSVKQRVSSKSAQEECQERVSNKSVEERVSSKSALSRVPCKSVRRGRPAKECQERVSSSQAREFFKSALQETRLLLDDCASHLRKDKTTIFMSAFVSVYSALHTVAAFGFVGSSRFLSSFKAGCFDVDKKFFQLPECVAKGSRLTWESEGRAGFARRCFRVRNRPQPSASVRIRLLWPCRWGELQKVIFHGCVTCQFASLVVCVKMVWQARKVMHFAAQAQGFVKVTRLRGSYMGFAVSEWCFFRGVGSRCYIGICSCKVASKAPFL